MISLLPDKIKSAKLTADWESDFLEIEQGKKNADDFILEIQKYISELCDEYGSVDDKVSFVDRKEVLLERLVCVQNAERKSKTENLGSIVLGNVV